MQNSPEHQDLITTIGLITHLLHILLIDILTKIIKGITNMIHKDVHRMAYPLADVIFLRVLLDEIRHTAPLDIEVLIDEITPIVQDAIILIAHLEIVLHLHLDIETIIEVIDVNHLNMSHPIDFSLEAPNSLLIMITTISLHIEVILQDMVDPIEVIIIIIQEVTKEKVIILTEQVLITT